MIFLKLCDRMRFEVNCAKSHHRVISDGLTLINIVASFNHKLSSFLVIMLLYVYQLAFHDIKLFFKVHGKKNSVHIYMYFIFYLLKKRFKLSLNHAFTFIYYNHVLYIIINDNTLLFGRNLPHCIPKANS